MKVLLYFENQNSIKKSGIGRALRHQMEALKENDVEFTLNPKDTFDIAHINTYFFKSKHLLRRCKRKGIPTIVHGHSTKEDFRNSFKAWKLMSLWFNPNLIWFYKHADLIITPTAYSKRCIDNYHLGTEVIHISNGIDLNEYAYDKAKVDAFKKHFNITDEKVVMSVGFPFNRKGIKDFFEIARKRPEIKFIWFGYLQPILITSDVKKAIRHKPDNVIMPGYIDNSIIKGAYHYAECLLFPSYEETEGIVVLEALASNCPVLIRDIGVYSDWLKDGRDCYKAANNEEFLEKLDLIMKSDNSELIKNGYKLVEERTLKKCGAELKEAYTKLLDKFNSEKK
ncbi:MAG: glycosyltransferase family 4 protein [Erysipelotrichaceae bacterium]|jgi:1,2-diacylglycerol-3-alpha-glucose alpha-1,2-glucosyltransferase|nr:glycosyltransferase family 4 protein [Erysipelotrichaceae bacterium]